MDVCPYMCAHAFKMCGCVYGYVLCVCVRMSVYASMLVCVWICISVSVHMCVFA